MKKFTAILLAAVLVMTCLATVACNNNVAVKVFLHYQDGKTNTQIEVYNDYFTLPTPTREGYTFGGWYLDETCTAGKEFAAGTPMEASFHLYAKWTKVTDNKQKYTVTFVFNDNKTDNLQVEVVQGQTVTFPQTPTRDGYTFLGWYESQQGGVQWALNTPITKDTTLYARWQAVGGDNTGGTTHTTHDFGNSYFLYVKCSGCDVYGRAESVNTYANTFVYNFNATKKAEIDACYDELLNYISTASSSNYNAFESKYETYGNYVDYIVEQYQYAYVFYCAYDDESYETDYSFVSNYYNEIIANFYGLYADIYESAYKNLFFDSSWSAADIEEALYLAEAYGGSSGDRNDIDDITDAYNALMEQLGETEDEDEYAALQAQLFDLYTQFVTVNNQIAQAAHYDNYMTYSYKNEYGREYTPAQAKNMHALVRQYIGPIIEAVAAKYKELADEDFETDESMMFYYGLAEDSVFGTTMQTYEEFYDEIGWLLEEYLEMEEAEIIAYWKQTNEEMVMANGYIGDYFKYLTSTTAGSKEINFFKHAEELFKNGNYYVGSAEQAYTYYISAQDLSILYFGGESYTNAFTFIHEFGHYYNGIYNGRMNLSMDHDETQSQGDEMLFLAWLADQVKNDSSLTNGFANLEMEQLFNILSTIVMSTAVDEFEQAAYTGTYNGQPLPTVTATINGQTKTVVDYQTLYETILASYWEGAGDFVYTDYWSYVVFDSAAYYISYAMSALPSLELYVNGRQNLNTARDSYFKLFTFSEHETAIDTDRDGECSYQEILNWCGLKGPFQQELYTTINTYFASRGLTGN